MLRKINKPINFFLLPFFPYLLRDKLFSFYDFFFSLSSSIKHSHFPYAPLMLYLNVFFTYCLPVLLSTYAQPHLLMIFSYFSFLFSILQSQRLAMEYKKIFKKSTTRVSIWRGSTLNISMVDESMVTHRLAATKRGHGISSSKYYDSREKKFITN